MIKNFPVSVPPHTRAQNSASGMTWHSVFALIPAFLILLVKQPFDMLRMTGLVFAVSFLIEAGTGFLLKKKGNFKDGSLALWALLLILALPSETGFIAVICAAAVTVFLGKEFYGGRTGVWVHPSWLGYAFMVLSFPRLFVSGEGALLFWNPFTSIWSVLITLAFLSGGLSLLLKRSKAWEVPLLYLVLVFIPCLLMGLRATLSLPLILLNAFWVLPDTGTAPCSRRARAYTAIGAALLTLVLDLLSVPAAPVFAVLMLNLLMPWIDEWILPRGISFEARVDEAKSFS